MMKSSFDWLNTPEFAGIVVVDPDGWDRKNYEASMTELITCEEFRKRLLLSTSFSMV